MFVAFDAAKILCAGSWETKDHVLEGTVGTIHLLPRCSSPQEVLERADLHDVQPFIMNVLDFNDETKQVRQEWKNVLLAGPTEDSVRLVLEKMFGRLWSHGGKRDDGSDDPNEYPPRFMVVEVPADRTWGAKWIGCEGAPRAVSEA
jgi:hypothetical protein